MLNRASLRLWSIGGGKGGIGKSILTLGLGLHLARRGRQVILIDADLGGANLHTLLGLRQPPVTMEDFFQKYVARLEDTIIPTSFGGLGLICGADNVLGSANITYPQKIRLLKEMEALPADFVLLDLGAGTSFNILDLFNHSPGKIVLCTPQTTSLQSAYGFIKAALYRRLSREFAKHQELLRLLDRMNRREVDAPWQALPELLERLKGFTPEIYWCVRRVLEDFHLFLVVNMVQQEGEEKSPEIVQTVCAEFLRLRPQILGTLDYDPVVEQVVNRMEPRLLLQGKSRAVAGLERMAQRLLVLGRLAGGYVPEPQAEPDKTPRPALKVLCGQAT
ncbi:MAG: P-loop NTPase [Deltaproteobacteria bacterium]|nr:P-loop NTPase [Deltaproteobacteria bacterium]